MSLLVQNGEIVLFLASVLAANGVAVALWMLVVHGRSRGQRRCPRCWYSMEGAIADGHGGYECPECGRRVTRERRLYRTRRHWRRAWGGFALLLIAGALAGTVLLRNANPWRYAPDAAIIDAIPRMRGWGKLTSEFTRRRFLEGYEPILGVYNNAYPPLDPSGYRMRSLRGFERRLLARRAAEALETNPSHPHADELLILLVLSGEQRERAFAITQRTLSAGGGWGSHNAIAILRLVAPSEEGAAAILTSRLFALAAADPSLSNDGDRVEAMRLVEALGHIGPAAQGAVSLLTSMLSVANPTYPKGVYIPVIRTLGLIGPAAGPALPQLKGLADLSTPGAGDDIEGAVAKLLIEGACATEEEAFIRLLEHTSWRARRAAATHLGYMRSFGDAARTALLKALDDRNEYVKETAAESLLEHGLEREACHRALLRVAPEHGEIAMWAGVQMMWRFDLDPTDAIPQLEEDLARATERSVRANLAGMIERIKRKQPFDGPEQTNRRR